MFIQEGAWTPVARDVRAGAFDASSRFRFRFRRSRADIEIYVSPIQPPEGWAYARGERFLRIVAEVAANGEVRILRHEITTRALVALAANPARAAEAVRSPVRTITQNHRLIRSMARRDILARYRGSFGDVFWTVLNPLLLMATYFFVFGVVLQTRFGPDQSRTGVRALFPGRDAAVAGVLRAGGPRART